MTLYASGLTKDEYVGAGAFGEVFRCSDPVQGDVAGKFIYASQFANWTEWSVAKSNAIMEAQKLTALEHANTLRVYSVLAHPLDNEFLIVCEYCDDGSARQICQSNLVRLTTTKGIVRDAALGLSFIHGKGYLHRDIKPDNILLQSNGGVKVGDFGFVTDQLMFGFATPVGTPVYWAPEVFNNKVCSHLSDVYSLGATLVHLVSGEDWFVNNQFQGLIYTNEHGLPTLREKPLFLPHVPKDWRTKISKLLRHNPSKRCASMSEALDLISRLCPVEDWQCEVLEDLTRWTLDKGERRVCVEWRDCYARNSSWIAWSEDQIGQQKHTISRLSSPMPWRETYKSLQDFFQMRTSRLK